MERVYYLRDDQKIVFNPANGDFSLSRGTPLICIVSNRNPNDHKIKYGYAILHSSEDISNFSKAEGRKEANKKLTESPMELVCDATTGHEINRGIIQHFLDTVGKRNGKVRKLSKKWLKVAAAKAKSVKQPA